MSSSQAIEGTFENFKVNIQANTLTIKTHDHRGSYIPYHSCKVINLLKNTVLYCFNHVKGKCMSIIYQFDCYCITNRLQSDTFCNTKRIHFTECKYGNLQSDFPGFSRDRV